MPENKNHSPDKNILKNTAAVTLLLSVLACNVVFEAAVVFGVVESLKLDPWAYAVCCPSIFIASSLIVVNKYLNDKYDREHPTHHIDSGTPPPGW